jgi:hypothetical protein
MMRGSHLRYANNAGLKIVGDDNVVENVLIEDVDWLGTLDFPALEVGFDQWSSAEPPGKALAPTSSSSEVVPLQQRRLRRVDDRMYPRPTKGQRNTITKATVRRFGNAGIVTSQLANEISYSHVYAHTHTHTCTYCRVYPVRTNYKCTSIRRTALSCLMSVMV